MSKKMFGVAALVLCVGVSAYVAAGGGLARGAGLARWGSVAAPGAADYTSGPPVLSLADVARQEKNPDLRDVKLMLAKGFYDANHWATYTKMQTIRYQKISSGHAGVLPTPDRVALNQSLKSVGIDLGTHEAHAAFFGNVFENQKMIGEQPGMMDSLAQKILLYIEGVSAESNFDFIFGNPEENPRAFPGLAYRNVNKDRFKVAGLKKSLATGGNPLDLTETGMTPAAASTLARVLDDTFADLGAPNGAGCVIFGNRHAVGGFPAMMRDAKRNLPSAEKADFGREVLKYGQASIVDIGQKSGAGTADANMILKPAGNGASSLWVVNFNRFKPWQTNEMVLQKAPKTSNIWDYYEFLWGCGAIEQNAFAYKEISDIKWRG
jgi:hypothetical protein